MPAIINLEYVIDSVMSPSNTPSGRHTVKDKCLLPWIMISIAPRGQLPVYEFDREADPHGHLNHVRSLTHLLSRPRNRASSRL